MFFPRYEPPTTADKVGAGCILATLFVLLLIGAASTVLWLVNHVSVSVQ